MIFHVALLILLLFFSSCAQMQNGRYSGHYIILQKNETIDSIAEEMDVPVWEIEEANLGKNIAEGEWLFVPLKRGILENVIQNGPNTEEGFVSSGEFIWPVPSSKQISSSFGRRWGSWHNGIDIPAASGTHIIAAGNGVVVYSGDDFSGFGNVVIIAHRYGYFTLYAHNQKNYVKEGERIYRGQVIAAMGNTGRSTGPHLHFEIRKYSTPVNPIGYISNKPKNLIVQK